MKKFMLLLYDNVETLQEMSAEEMQQLVQAHMQWTEKLAQAGHLEGGDGLEETGAYIKGKNALVTDGPFVETKELIGGFYLITAESLEQAVEIAKECPCHQWGGTTEVRPIMDYAAPTV
ncbi:YciI family protein [Rufibacter roseus]|uniref:YciI family protein n=1 Tax=Rufibacter roseus TaxID=1567108 RepID=A0ABW2DQR5_9BACT|nr:YciI family protein [Rufibacter roseus]